MTDRQTTDGRNTV